MSFQQIKNATIPLTVVIALLTPATAGMAGWLELRLSQQANVLRLEGERGFAKTNDIQDIRSDIRDVKMRLRAVADDLYEIKGLLRERSRGGR